MLINVKRTFYFPVFQDDDLSGQRLFMNNIKTLHFKAPASLLNYICSVPTQQQQQFASSTGLFFHLNSVINIKTATWSLEAWMQSYGLVYYCVGD